jgi:putative ABC transport system permease protein
MALWRQLTRGLRALAHRDAADRDVADELQHYLDESTREHLERGLSPDAAHRAARVEIGSLTAAREQVRSSGWEQGPLAVVADLRYAARRLRRAPAFTLVAVLTLGLGIGATTAIFSAVAPILFEPLAYPNASRLVLLSDYAADAEPIAVTYGTYRELAERSRSFAGLAVADRWQPALMGLAEPERLTGARVSAHYFDVLGVAPARGRSFTAADDRPGAPLVALVGEGFVHRRFGEDAAILGRQIELDGDAYTVIGIMPRGFQDVLWPSAEVWAPRRYRDRASFQSAEWGHHMRMIGRLASGTSVEQARLEIAAIGRAPSASFPRPPWADLSQGLAVEPLQAAVTRGVRPALLAIFAAVGLLLAIACVNVAGLLLARGSARQRELAIRTALGAGRGRLVRQLVTESLLLAIAGGTIGLAVATSGLHALLALAPASLPRPTAVGLDSTTFAFAAALITLVGVAVGLAPALQWTREDLRSGAASGTRATGGSPHTLRRTLVVAELALALVLLVGAGLMVRSLARLFAVSPGFDGSHVLTMQVEAAGHAYDDEPATFRFFEQALDVVRHVPGVIDAAFTSQLPLTSDLDGYGVVFESIPRTDPNSAPNALRYAVTPNWFQTMGIPLRRGRLFNTFDRPGAPEAIVISESLARHAFPGRNPIGQRFRAGPEIEQTDRPWGIVVGVVGDVKQTSLALGGPDAFYVAMGQWPWVDNVQSLAVRTAGDPTALVPAVEHAIWSVDPNQPITRVATMQNLVGQSEAARHFVLMVFELFGLAALALAALGVYGMMAGSVTERLREIGVRAALGASRGRILRMVLRQGLGLAAIGALVGSSLALVASQGLATLIFGISRFDPLTYIGVLAMLVTVSMVACLLPAWRASRVDPVQVLRGE